MTKKIIAAILVVAMLAVVTSFSALAEGTATVSVSSGSAAPGGTVTVPVSLSNNTGIISLSVTISFDSSKLRVSSGGRGNLNGTTSISSRSGSVSLTWNANSTSNVTKSGTLAKLTFEVLSGASTGDSVSLSVSASGQYYPEEGGSSQSASIGTGSGLITVTSSDSTAAPETSSSPKATAANNCKHTSVDSNWTVIKAATCTNTGTEAQCCKLCGESVNTRTIAALGHVYSDEYTVDREATCTVDGVKSHHCTRNGCTATTGSVNIAATGHSFGDYVVTKKATATATGVQTRTCSVCGEKETETIPKSSTSNHTHSYTGKTVVSKEATCTADGKKKVYCSHSGCTAYKTITIPKLGHQEELTVTKEATCLETGEATAVCARCGKDLGVQTIPATEHTPGEWVVEKEATCTEGGVEIQKCAVCGETMENRVTLALEHAVEEWTVVKSATDTEEGERTGVCTSCGQTVTEIIPAGASVEGDPNGTKWEYISEAGILKMLDAPMPGDATLVITDESTSKEAEIQAFIRQCTAEKGIPLQVLRLDLQTANTEYVPSGNMVIGVRVPDAGYRYYTVYSISSEGQLQAMNCERQDAYLAAATDKLGLFLVAGSNEPIGAGTDDKAGVLDIMKQPGVMAVAAVVLVAVAAVVSIVTKKKRR